MNPHGGQAEAPPAAEANPETVQALLETTWRVIDAEAARREGLNRKASSLATFAALILSVTSTLGARFLERLDETWALALFLASLASLVMTIALALFILLPRGRATLGLACLERFPSWSEVTKAPEQHWPRVGTRPPSAVPARSGAIAFRLSTRSCEQRQSSSRL